MKNPITFITDLVDRARKSTLVETTDNFNGITVTCKCHAAGTKVRTSLHVLGRRRSTEEVRRMLIATTQDQSRVWSDTIGDPFPRDIPSFDINDRI